MHFPLLRLPNLGTCRVPGLRPSNPTWQSGTWACLSSWGWLSPSHMREQNEYFLWVVQASSSRPTKCRATSPPIFSWLVLAFYLMRITRFCSLPLLARCFGSTVAWNISSWFWALNKKFWRQHCQTVVHCLLWWLGESQIDRRCSSKQTSWHFCPWC